MWLPLRSASDGTPPPAGTRSLGTFPEGPLKVLKSGTYRGHSEDSQETIIKIDYLMKKLVSQLWKSRGPNDETFQGGPWDVGQIRF